MKRRYLIVLIFLAVVAMLGFILLILRSPEDSYIKDSRGVWIKHGKPSAISTEVAVQQELIQKAADLYSAEVAEGADLSQGPCLGKIDDDWVADITHSPRQAVDDQIQNQCSDFIKGIAHHFIELDPNGNIVRVQ